MSPLVISGILTLTLTTLVACSVPADEQPADSATAALSRPEGLWHDVTVDAIGTTAEWTNKVELADLDVDGRVDILFANGGNYSEPGVPEANRVFMNRGNGRRFEERTAQVFGDTRDFARVIKVRDVNNDGWPDIMVGTTFEKSRLYLGVGDGAFTEVTDSHLPRMLASIGDLEFGDVDGDADLDLVLADWGQDHNMTNAGGTTKLWLNDGTGHFVDATDTRMPSLRVRFSWDLELVDVDNDYDLDILVSCKRCPGSSLFRNDGTGVFEEDPRGLPVYTNNYEFEAMDLDADGFLDLVTVNDGAIVDGVRSSRREHVFRNDGEGRFDDVTTLWWPAEENLGEDDNMVAFLDYDSDGDADFLLASLTGPDRLLVNDGTGGLRQALDVFVGEPTPGTLSMALTDLDGDGRLDVVQGQGEHRTAVAEKIFLGTGLAPDTAPATVTMVEAQPDPEGGIRIRARVHDRKSPSQAAKWRGVDVRYSAAGQDVQVPMQWYGEYLWRVTIEPEDEPGVTFRVCAIDRAGNEACSNPHALDIAGGD